MVMFTESESHGHKMYVYILCFCLFVFKSEEATASTLLLQDMTLQPALKRKAMQMN